MKLMIITFFIMTVLALKAPTQEYEDLSPSLKDFEDKRTEKEEQMEKRNQNASVIIESGQIPDFPDDQKRKSKIKKNDRVR